MGNRLGFNPCAIPPTPRVEPLKLGEYLVSLMRQDPRYTEKDVRLLISRLMYLGW